MSQNKTASCHCPYCSGPVAEQDTICRPCNVHVIKCPACGRPMPKDAPACPTCSGKEAPNTRREKP